MGKERIEYLDSLRGLAAMSVIIFHCMISFKLFYEANYNSYYSNWIIKILTESPLKIFWSGNEAVLLFFVLSGFVLSLSILKYQSFHYISYISKRFARIYIPYAIIMMISVLLCVIFYNFTIQELSPVFNNRWENLPKWESILAYILMINYDTSNVNGVVWTLYHEMRISFIFPFIALIISKFNFLKSLVYNGGVLLIGWVSLDLLSIISNDILRFLFIDFKATLFYTIFFIFGATLAKYRRIVVKFISENGRLFKCGLFTISIFLIGSQWIYNFMPIKHFIINDLMAGIGIVILFSVALSSILFQKILLMKPLLFLGKISYSLYLIHILVLMLLSISLGQIIDIRIAIALTPILSIPLAYITYIFVEKPSIILAKKISDYFKNMPQTKKIENISPVKK